MVYLPLGYPGDLCRLGGRAAPEARDLPVRIFANPLAHPSRFAWRLDNALRRWKATRSHEALRQHERGHLPARAHHAPRLQGQT